MLYYDKHFGKGSRIAIWHVTEDLEELYYLLPDDEKVRKEAHSRFKSPSRIMEWTAVRVLLCDMLDRQVDIIYDESGAPHLPDYEGMDISISHTKGYVAIGLSLHGEIGIDIEQISPRVEKVRTRFIRDDEDAESLHKQLLHWSAKETAFKMLHRRKVDFLKHLKVSQFRESEEGVFQLQEFRTDENQVFDINYKIFPEFVLTYSCTEETS
jgi:phosphopantetheinyl transferase